jgi:hypothetical protein
MITNFLIEEYFINILYQKKYGKKTSEICCKIATVKVVSYVLQIVMAATVLRVMTNGIFKVRNVNAGQQVVLSMKSMKFIVIMKTHLYQKMSLNNFQ